MVGRGRSVPCAGDFLKHLLTPESAPTSDPEGAPRGRVLVADDELSLARSLCRVLAGAGYEVLTVADGPSAFDALKQHDFDVILSDISMPGMGGYKFASAIKQDAQWRSTPVIGLAADTDGDDKGTFDALTRKFDREGLLETVRGFIGSRERAA